MAASTTLLQFLLMVVAGWLHRQQAAVIEYLITENRLLCERLGGRRIIFTDAERRTLAEKMLGRGTIRRILKDHGFEPAPVRGQGMPWSVFLKAHWKALVAADLFSVEVWSWRGLTTHYVLFVIDLATRRIHIAGITVHPNAGWMMQVGRNLLDVVDGPLVGKKYLILDRDTKYSAAFRQMLLREGVRVIRLPPRSPNLNAYAERWIRGVRDECLSKVIPIGQRMLHRALREYVAHHHLEHNHQGLGNALITPCSAVGSQDRTISRRSRLGGILNYYERIAA